MAIQQRIFILVGALLAFFFVCQRIRKEKILIEDSIFWVVFAFVLVIIAAFPGIAISLAHLLGFISPINFVFLLVIALLLVKVFSNSSEISMLKSKVNDLAQEIALRDADDGDADQATKATPASEASQKEEEPQD